jgi:predicted RNase H-like HicB family nuclease
MMSRYSSLIEWSKADQLYLVTIPEFDGRVMQPCTSGKTYEEALHNAQDCIQACLEAWESDAEEAPQPREFAIAS